MKRNTLRQEYYKSAGGHWKNKEGDVNIEYVNWVEDKLTKDDMKDLKITTDFADTCIEFGKYVQNQHKRNEDADILWLEYQDKLAKDVMKVLDDCTDDTVVKDNFTTEKQDKVNKAILDAINKSNEHQENINSQLIELCKLLNERTTNNTKLIELLTTIVKNNDRALGKLESSLNKNR